MRSDSNIIISEILIVAYNKISFHFFKDYSNLFRMFGLEQLIEEPARITCTSKSLIDHILFNNR